MQAAIEWSGLAAIVAASFACALALGWLLLGGVLRIAAPTPRGLPAGARRKESALRRAL